MSEVIANVNKAVKAAVAELNAQIKEITKKRDQLLSIIGTDSTPVAQVKAGAKKAAGGKRGPGMLNILLPQMEGKASMKAPEMLKLLHASADYKGAKINSLYATVANELKKPNSRLERIADGEYRVSAAYFQRPIENTPEAAPAEATV